MTGITRPRVGPRLILIGIFSGFVGGLLGVGGGGVMVPLLVAIVGIAQRSAHAISLGAVVPLALSAAVVYGVADEVQLGTAVTLFLGGAIGAPVGAWLLSRTNDRRARHLFGLLLVCTSTYLLVT